MIRVSIALMIVGQASVAFAAGHERTESDPLAPSLPIALAPEPMTSGLSERPRTLPPRALVEERTDVPDRAENRPKGAIEASTSGGLSAFTVSPVIPRVATAIALSGYDTASSSFRARGATEGLLSSFLAARIEYEHGPANGPSDRVSLGLRATLLNQARHGITLGALAFYQPRDFREEGDVVVGLLGSRSFGPLTLVLNSLVGSDPEGDDRSFELRLGSVYRANSWLVVGLDSRGRYNLSSDQKRAGQWGIDAEAQAGVTAAFGWGPLQISALVGPSLLDRTFTEKDGRPGERRIQSGLMAMAGAGASF